MFKVVVFLILSLVSAYASATCSPIRDFSAQKLRSQETINFCNAFDDKVLLVVNTASKCGFTPQFKELESLYQRYRAKGLEIVGFPSNDFSQEFSDSKKTANICYINYGVTFTMLEASSVKGTNANTLFKMLAEATGHAPGWNFNKYLISRTSHDIRHYASRVSPLSNQLDADIRMMLSE
ncbi:MAG: glutathione peroxidase [Pseudomonadota bacterium]